MIKNIVVKETKNKGRGVFALKDFKKGDVVVDWSTCSTILSEINVKRLPKNKKKYTSYLGKRKWVLFRSPGKYMNHSCDPNTKAIKGADVAVRPINKGEEITVDYIYEKVPVGKMKCICGSRNCKGYITSDFFTLPEKSQRLYLPYTLKPIKTEYRKRQKTQKKL